MPRFFKKLFRQTTSHIPNNKSQEPISEPTKLITPSLSITKASIREMTGNSPDIVIREVRIGTKAQVECCIIHVEGLADKQVLNLIMESIVTDKQLIAVVQEYHPSTSIFDMLKNNILNAGSQKEFDSYENLLDLLLSGDTIILIEGLTKGLAVSSKGWEKRGIEEPAAQTVVRGPRESFTESINTNITQIRRRIKDKNLRLEMNQIGRISKTNVAIMYINEIANDKIVQEVRIRLDRIDIDSILESGYIEELISDGVFSLFPTVYNSERPDIVVSALFEGRIAILVDGTPFVLIVPALFLHFFQAAEDYYQRFEFAFLIRVLRVMSFFISLLAPSLYIAFTTFHQELIPSQLLISIAAQREIIPFPAFIEALMMEIIFEILREAGIRMPRAIGSAISIVGALVVGQAAVEAGLISPAMVIIVSLTAIANFVFPSYNMAISIRILRFGFMILAASFGLYGVSLGIIAMFLFLSSLRSFGIPYMTPFAPFIFEEQKDTLLRFPIWALFRRPKLISKGNLIRQQKPLSAKPKSPSK